MKYFAIGDIHGNYKALLQCLERSNFNYEEDTLIGIGDYVDGFPEPHLVVEELLKIKNFIGIRGNHDVWFHEFLKYGIPNSNWLKNGGKATLIAYHNSWESYRDSRSNHEDFFRKLNDYYILELNGQKYGFVHGGWCSEEGLGYDRDYNYHWDRHIWNGAVGNFPSGREYVEKRWGDFDKVFIGHTATVRDFPDAEPPVAVFDGKLVNLDQGAGWSGKLTICNIQTLECFQSDESQSLYPGMGR